MRGSDWTVVGIFESGDANESELWADVEVAAVRPSRAGYSSVRLQLADATGLQTVKDALTADPRLNVDVQTEEQYYSGQTKQFRQTIGMLAGVVTLIMALGAMFAALNTMYAAVGDPRTRDRDAARDRLRRLPGGRLGHAGVACCSRSSAALLGALIAYLLFNNMAVSTLGANFTQIVFRFAVTPALVQKGLVIARRDRHGRRIPAGAAGRAPAGDDGAPRRLNRVGGR